MEYISESVVGQNVKSQNSIAFGAFRIRFVIEVLVLTISLAIDYVFNSRLLWNSVRSGKQAVMSIVASDEASTHNLEGEPTIAILEARLIAAQKKKIAVRMISIFGVLLFFDVATITAVWYSAFSSLLNDYLFTQLIVFSGCWLPFRLWAIFELLDLFLNELKSASTLQLINTSGSNHTEVVDLRIRSTSLPPDRGPQQQIHTWNTSIANTFRRADKKDTFASSHTSDIVDLSLRPSTSLPMVNGSQHQIHTWNSSFSNASRGEEEVKQRSPTNRKQSVY
jgi:hypothetical protein